MVPTVYIDVLFAVNLLINYILLSACGSLCGLKKQKYRIAFGALVGAFYALLIFFPDFSVLYTTLSKLLISMVLVACAYPFYSFKTYVKALFVFYLVSFGFGGCVLGVFCFSDMGARLGAVYSNGILYFDLPWAVLLLSGLLFLLLTRVFALTSAFRNKSSLKKSLRLSLGGRTAELTALLDTGNGLVDPVTLSPVIIAEYKSIKPLFSDEIRLGLDRLGNENVTWVMQDVTQKGLKARLIPFSSVGHENGMLLGFVPDRAEICDDCGVRVLKSCVVGIYEKQLACDRSYCALFNPYL